jgi:hypothetical protein
MLGAGAITFGIAMRSQLGRGWWHMPEVGIIVVLASLVALRGGVSHSLLYVSWLRKTGDNEDYPTILWALPFFAFGMACFTAAVFGIEDVKGHVFDVAGDALVRTAGASILLSLLVIIGIGLARLWRAFDKITEDPKNRP